jgi:hypothetical protein
MQDFTISILNNKIFFEIIKELKIFSDFQIKYYTDENLCINDAKSGNKLIIFFDSYLNVNNLPALFIKQSPASNIKLVDELIDQLEMPFKILEFKKKAILLISKTKFKKNSLINLNGYIIDKNERKIKKNNIELSLSEKEVNVLILFSQSSKSINKKLVLKHVWNYSLESETHTVETHIHRLRKKILEKFSDNNFIKNDNNGYYI